jgi:hypothetical protein
MLMSTYNSGIDHHVFVVVIARQQLEDTLENPALRPPKPLRRPKPQRRVRRKRPADLFRAMLKESSSSTRNFWNGGAAKKTSREG